jgi:hypothetical protein
LVAADHGGGGGGGGGKEEHHANVVMVVMSDNGGSPFFGGNNAPLRAAKTTPFEGGVRVPAFAVDFTRGGAYLGAGGRQWGGLSHVSDWMPTLLAIADTGTTEEKAEFGGGPLDGMDLSGALRGGSASPRTELLHEMYFASRGEFPFAGEDVVALRRGKWKLVDGVVRDPWHYTEFAQLRTLSAGSSDPSWATLFGELLIRATEPVFGVAAFDAARIQIAHVLTHRKFAEAQIDQVAQAGVVTGVAGVGPTVRLFDIEADPREQHNVAAAHPEVVARLRARAAELGRARLTQPLKWWLGYHPQTPPEQRGQVKGDCSAFPGLSQERCSFAAPWVADSVGDPFEDPKNRVDVIAWGTERRVLFLQVVVALNVLLAGLSALACARCRRWRRVAAGDNDLLTGQEKMKKKKYR